MLVISVYSKKGKHGEKLGRWQTWYFVIFRSGYAEKWFFLFFWRYGTNTLVKTETDRWLDDSLILLPSSKANHFENWPVKQLSQKCGGSLAIPICCEDASSALRCYEEMKAKGRKVLPVFKIDILAARLWLYVSYIAFICGDFNLGDWFFFWKETWQEEHDRLVSPRN